MPVQRLSMALCPACESPNADEARFCAACGTPLVMRCPACDTINVRTRHVCHRCRAALRVEDTVPASLGADDEPTAPVIPLLVPEGDAGDGGWTLSLRSVSVAAPAPPTPPVARRTAAGAGEPRAAARGAADPTADGWQRPLTPARQPPGEPGLPELVVTDGWVSPRASDPAEVPMAQGAPAPPATPATRAVPGERKAPTKADGAPATATSSRPNQVLKAERRAKVRRRQLQGRRTRADEALPQDVLLLEPDPASRAALCELLDIFGFRPYLAASAGEALGMATRRRYAAVLLGLDADPGAAAALCQQLRQLPSLGTTAVFAIGDPRRHADRVRMQLAGADDTLLRPVGRGTLARALDGMGVVLPNDPRLGRAPQG